jgi:hypothetical protein
VASCKQCGSVVPDAVDRCPTCGADAGFPNVRAASTATEVAELTARYSAAIADSRSRGAHKPIAQFEKSMQNTAAVINVDLRFLFFFLSSDKDLYSTYRLGVRAQTRKVASESNDRHRTGVEDALFGSYGEQIRYAALSLDGSGPKSYGAFAIKLRDVAVRDRASLLEENSYMFVERHQLRPGQDIPLGYRAIWADRHRLAVAKLAKRISTHTAENAFAEMLLISAGSRADDDFIEIHIYGPLDSNAIESVMGKSKLKNLTERGLAAASLEYLSKMGKTWIEA